MQQKGKMDVVDGKYHCGAPKNINYFVMEQMDQLLFNRK
jgi:hypothetical protein